MDANQAEIVLALAAHGWTVQSLAPVGCGCPDLLVGARGVNVLLELKDPEQPPSGRELTAHQRKWHGRWDGQAAVVETADEAVGAVLAEIARRWGKCGGECDCALITDSGPIVPCCGGERE